MGRRPTIEKVKSRPTFSPTSERVRERPSRSLWLVWASVGLAAATLLSYSPALKAPFLFDDITSIEQNSSISRLWPLSIPLNPPPETSVSGRPVVNYSLALNFELAALIGVGKQDGPSSEWASVLFRLFNVCLHLACGAVIFSLIRRTVRRQRVDEVWAANADGIALMATTLWLLHPIQSEAINYVVQRTEQIVSLCYLGTLYASIRAWDASSTRRRLGWYAVGVLICLLGMGSKEVMISAPLAVVLYDRAFRLRSWRDVTKPGQGRGWFYLALAATTSWLIVLLSGVPRGKTVGFNLGMPWYQYLYSQAWAITHYVRLFFWPDQLTFDYGASPVHGLVGVPGLILLTAFGAATIAAWTRPERWGWFGFLGAWFFMILAPSSSFVPITTEIAAERRIYLPLIAVILLLMAGVDWVRRRVGRVTATAGAPSGPRPDYRWGVASLAVVALFYLAISGWKARQMAPSFSDASSVASVAALEWLFRVGVAAVATAVAWQIVLGRHIGWVVAAVALVLAATTYGRSETYGDAQRLWTDVFRKVPNNSRAYYMLGTVLLFQTPPREVEADALFHKAIALDPQYADGWDGLAQMAIVHRRFAEAKGLVEREVAIRPNDSGTLGDMGDVLIELGQPAQALPYLLRATAVTATNQELFDLGRAYAGVGRADEAARTLLRLVQLDPMRTDALSELGALLTGQGRAKEAIPYLERAVMGSPTSGLNLARLSLAYADAGRARDAFMTASHAAARAGDDAGVYVVLGHAMLRSDSTADAERYLSTALQLTPDDPETITTLGDAKLSLGKKSDAVQLYRRALATHPDYGPARDALGRALGGR